MKIRKERTRICEAGENHQVANEADERINMNTQHLVMRSSASVIVLKLKIDMEANIIG